MELKPVRTNDATPEDFRGNGYPPAGEEAAYLAEGQRVLRNTYLLLALTMVPTVIGAFIGMATASFVMAHPIAVSLVMLAAVIGLQYAIDRCQHRSEEHTSELQARGLI